MCLKYYNDFPHLLKFKMYIQSLGNVISMPKMDGCFRE